MTGLENGDLLIQLAAWAGLTVFKFESIQNVFIVKIFVVFIKLCMKWDYFASMKGKSLL